MHRWCGARLASQEARAMHLSAQSVCDASWLRRWRVATSAAADLAATEVLRREVSDRFACLARLSAALRYWDAHAAARSEAPRRQP